MATKIDGETYLGEAVTLPLSADGQVTVYVWPCRILNIQGTGMGGPTIGVDVGNTETIRYDCHDTPGHWHKGGYDKLGAGGSHVEFPDDVRDVEGQIAWGLDQIKENGAEMLADAGFPDAAKALNLDMVAQAQDAIKERLAEDPKLISKAIDQGLIAA